MKGAQLFFSKRGLAGRAKIRCQQRIFSSWNAIPDFNQLLIFHQQRTLGYQVILLLQSVTVSKLMGKRYEFVFACLFSILVCWVW